MHQEPWSLRSRTLALTCVGLGLLGCGGAVAPAPQSTQAPAARMTELDALERDFEIGAQQLALQLRRRHDLATPSRPSVEEEAAQAPEKKNDAGAGAPAPSPVPAPANEPAPDYAVIGSPCDLMCRALASMQRSAAGICSLAGDQHERCSKARLRLELSERQVRDAGCACSG